MKKITKLGLICLLIGIMGLVISAKEIAISYKEPVDLYEDTISEIKEDMAVEADISMVLDYCAYEEKTTTNRRFRMLSSTSLTYYYIIPAYIGEQTYFICAEVPENKVTTFENLANSTWEYLSNGDETVLGSYKTEGGIFKMDSEIHSYMKEWFELSGFYENSADIDTYVLPYVFSMFDYDRTKQFMFWMIGIAVAGLAILAFPYIVVLADRNKGGMAAEVSYAQPQPVQAVNRSLTRTTIEVAGVEYPIEKFAQADFYMKNGHKGRAMEVIKQVAGVSLAEAKLVADNWDQLYC